MNMRVIRQALSTFEDAFDSDNEDLEEYEAKLEGYEKTIEDLKEEILEWEKKYEELEGAQENV